MFCLVRFAVIVLVFLLCSFRRGDFVTGELEQFLWLSLRISIDLQKREIETNERIDLTSLPPLGR